MKLRKMSLSLLLITALLLPLFQIAALADSDVVSVNAIAPINQGGSVTVSGETTLSEVIVKVLRPDSSVVFYDIVPVSSRQYTSSFTLGSAEPVGVYTVVVGQANQVATTTYSVSRSGTGPGGPGGSGPIGGTITPPPATTPIPTRPGSVGVDTSANKVDTVTGDDGLVTTVVTQDPKALADAFSQMTGTTPSVTITVNNAAGTGVSIKLPASVLANAAVNTPNAIIDIQSNEGRYSLPLSVLNLAEIARSLGTDVSNINIQVNISEVPFDINARIKASALGIETSQLGIAIQFTVTASGNGNSVELNNFGTTYVERTVVLTTSIDQTHSTVVLYNPTTGEFSFVPALFEGQADGTSKVTFKRNGNSIYTVLSSAKTFGDVTSHWAKKDIELLASKLVISGVTGTSFAPEGDITRAEFAALLVRSLGLTSDAASATFTDVKASDWYAGAIGAAVKAKLVAGFNDNTFKPNATITREQMAVMVANAITATGQSSDVTAMQTNGILAKFQDNTTISNWAQLSVAQSVEANIISGMTPNTFVPSANATRAQAAVMLKRFMQHVEFIN